MIVPFVFAPSPTWIRTSRACDLKFGIFWCQLFPASPVRNMRGLHHYSSHRIIKVRTCIKITLCYEENIARRTKMGSNYTVQHEDFQVISIILKWLWLCPLLTREDFWLIQLQVVQKLCGQHYVMTSLEFDWLTIKRNVCTSTSQISTVLLLRIRFARRITLPDWSKRACLILRDHIRIWICVKILDGRFIILQTHENYLPLVTFSRDLSQKTLTIHGVQWGHSDCAAYVVTNLISHCWSFHFQDCSDFAYSSLDWY